MTNYVFSARVRRFYLCFAVLILVFGSSSIYADSSSKTMAKSARIIKDVSPKEAYSLIKDNAGNPDFIILDVRTEEEFREGHIQDAVNINYFSKGFIDVMNKLDKDKTYLIYCRTGGRSGKALNIMNRLNFKKVYNLSDGILGWIKESLPVVR